MVVAYTHAPYVMMTITDHVISISAHKRETDHDGFGGRLFCSFYDDIFGADKCT